MRLAPIRRILLGCLLAAALSVPAHAEPQVWKPLDGTWEGELHSDAGVARTFVLPVRIEIHGAEVDVFATGEGDVQHIRPGTFVLQRERTNAVFTSIVRDVARPPGEGWVETWSFVVVMRDDDTLATTFVRAVNNNDLPKDDPTSTFMWALSGDLQRVPDV